MTNGLPPISDECFKLIGQIAAVWSRTEYIMQRLLVHLTCDDPHGGMLLSLGLNFETRKRLLGSLAHMTKQTNKDDAKEWNMMLCGLQSAYGERNHFAHGLWADQAGIETPELLVFRDKGVLTLAREPTEIGRVEESLATILAAEAELLRQARENGLVLEIPEQLGLQ